MRTYRIELFRDGRWQVIARRQTLAQVEYARRFHEFFRTGLQIQITEE